MARISRDTMLSPDYINKQLSETEGSLSQIQGRILEMISDSDIELQSSDLKTLSGSVALIRSTSDSLFRLLDALSSRIETENNLRKRLEALENSEAKPAKTSSKASSTKKNEAATAE